MKARGRRPSAFIVSRCLETPVKHDVRVFDMASKTIHTSLVIRGYCFSALISHEIMYFKNNQNAGILLLFVVKPRPNDRNTPTQHIATLLGATCCVRLATMLRCVAMCWVLLAQV